MGGQRSRDYSENLLGRLAVSCQSRITFCNVATAAGAQWTTVFRIEPFLQVTAPAEVMKLRFQQRRQVRLGDMAVHAESGTRVIGKVVMAGHAGFTFMVRMGEAHRQNRGFAAVKMRRLFCWLSER